MLHTAARLYKHKTGQSIQRLSELVPDYFPELPSDRYGHENPGYMINHDIIYSTGPDGVDDKTAILYDPTNGTTSRGDIAIRKQE